MRALENLHAALRPGGVLLDVRPAPRHPWVEVERNGARHASARVVRLGQLDDSYRHGTLAVADAALRRILDTGQFSPECAETFTFIYHFESVAAWLDHLAEHWSSARVSPELVGRARAALPAKASGEVRILRDVRAARLRRDQEGGA